MKRFSLLLLALIAAIAVQPVAAAPARAHRQVNSMLPGPVTISGRIRDFKPDSIVTAIIVNVQDAFLNQTGSRVIPINSDGTFSRTFKLPHAQLTRAHFYPDSDFKLYLEPGADIDIEIDNSVLARDARSCSNVNDDIKFGGKLGSVNAELASAPPTNFIYAFGVGPNVTPKQFKDSVMGNYNREISALERYASTLPANSKAPDLLRADILGNALFSMFQYDHADPHRMLPQEYYRDFVGMLLNSDSLLMTTEHAGTVLNNFAYSKLFPNNRYSIDMVALKQAVEFINSHDVESSASDENRMKGSFGAFTPEEYARIYSPLDTVNGAPVQDVKQFDAMLIMDALTRASDRVGVKKEVAERFASLFSVGNQMESSNFYAGIARQPEFLREYFGLEKLPPIWDYTIGAREWESIMTKDTLDLDSYGIVDPTLRSRLAAQHAELTGGNEVDEPSPAMDYLQQLIAPYRGKYLYVDFWDLYCGPCRSEIQNSVDFRAKYKDSPDFAFLFLASESGSPRDGWEKYCKEYMPHNVSLRLPQLQRDLLGELLNFTSIPFGVIFDREGRIVETNCIQWQFQQLLREKSLIDEQ